MPAQMTIADNPHALRDAVLRWKRQGQSVGLVPTMGALHAGHLSLVEEAGRHADRIVVSIFVNPTQFAPSEDLAAYPRTFEVDRALLARQRVDLVYAPSPADMYATGFCTEVVLGGVACAGLEDAVRPHFFGGVATVVAKLLIQSAADVAVFGEKDFQQLVVVKRMVADLDLPVRIVGAATIREPDGLALSSRNRFLSETERRTAALLPRVLRDVAAALRAGSRPASEVLEQGRRDLADAGFRVDYLEARDAETLEQPSGRAPVRILAAARLGTTRLIDNVAV